MYYTELATIVRVCYPYSSLFLTLIQTLFVLVIGKALVGAGKHLIRKILDSQGNDAGEYHCYPSKHAQGAAGFLFGPCYPNTYAITFPVNASLDDRLRLMGIFLCYPFIKYIMFNSCALFATF
jgi:hypothetical protein